MCIGLQQSIVLALKITPMNSSPKEIEEVLTVKNPDAAELLFQSSTHQFLLPFMHEALSVKDASEHLEQPLNKVHYQINKLCSFGLLKIADTFMHKGRERKLYKANVSGYFIPFNITKTTDLKDFLRAQDAQYYDHMLDIYSGYLLNSPFNVETTGVHLGLEEKENLFRLSLTDDPSRPRKNPFPPNVYAMSDPRFKLSFEDAVAFQDEVKAVFEKYRKKDSGPAYVIRFSCAPWK